MTPADRRGSVDADSPPLEYQRPVAPTFRPDDDRPGLTVVDPVRNKRYPLQTSDPVTLHESDPDAFCVPVDVATAFTAASLLLPYVVPTVVRDRHGRMLTEVEHNAYEPLGDGEYHLELMTPIRLCLRVEGPLTIASSDRRLAFAFDGPTRLHLGARSPHERPAATVTTTTEPAALAAAVSTFGSALKTTSPERSLPTLRGHPPRLELGDALEIPATVEPPATGVRLVVPDDRAAVYAASSLAYYLGATVTVGDEPRLETDRGFTHPLGRGGPAFERSLEEVLEQLFFVDCLVRTEGLYRIDLDERHAVEERLDADFTELYHMDLSARLEAYLSLPFEAVADVFPPWQLVTHVTDDPENARLLPFLANDLSIIRSGDTDTPSSAGPPALGLEEFVRSAAPSDSAGLGLDAFVSPPETDAIEQAWAGPGVPVGANKLLPAGFEHGLTAAASSDRIEITIVCNDPRMLAEVDGVAYGDREELPFDVTVHREVTVEELRGIFAADTDFVHYVGHVEDGAFVCRDGTLPAESLTDVGVDFFLLNGCLSYEIGVELIEAGSVGGIVTVSEVGNPDAVAVGRLVARLLNTGFTLRSAVDVARSYRLVGAQYVVVGDGGAAVTQSGGGVPNVCHVESADTDGDRPYRVRLQLYHCSDTGMGSAYIPYIDGIDRYFLVGGELPTLSLSGSALTRFLRLEGIPVEFDGEWYWSTDEVFEEL
ncbi:hypothetical protein [Natronobiforma cellulositropha]|uniref:hypothetical protein n=1 Tax=Natronobiforma cellulositropha TaxID=1679076 RepID=UPI0021D5BA98|nr:hypothetical protein [Natronobiforma cellulositropha]